jgi:hypothetical protein
MRRAGPARTWEGRRQGRAFRTAKLNASTGAFGMKKQQTLIFGIELAPGDKPVAVEQVNGDLLIPSSGRARLEQALLLAEDALPAACKAELKALVEARRLLGVAKPDREKDRLHAQLLKIAAI